MTGREPQRTRALVTLKTGDSDRARTLVRALAVEAGSEEGSTRVELSAQRGGQVRLILKAPRPSLLRAALKAYLQWAACCHKVSLQTDLAPIDQEQ